MIGGRNWWNSRRKGIINGIFAPQIIMWQKKDKGNFQLKGFKQEIQGAATVKKFKPSM